MTTKSYSLTLTRWHKVVERLLAEMTRISNNVEGKLAQMSLSLAARNTSSEQTITTAAADVETMSAQHLQLNESVIAIKSALASANAKHGVSARLCEVDGLNRRMKLLASIHAIESTKQHTYTDYKAMEITSVAQRSIGRVLASNPDSVEIKVLTAQRLSEIDQSTQEIRRAIHALSDESADINKTKLSIALPEVAAKAAGIDRE